ncbi:MAG: hypothetical protein K0S53_2324 [Bacteroidetes bacterium]|jgi:hypothetical protein|nr:hypothetical protein [Bacteroidota bacterium]MDF2450573.1 hypothetical protein [Bacteroidota bacterium]
MFPILFRCNFNRRQKTWELCNNPLLFWVELPFMLYNLKFLIEIELRFLLIKFDLSFHLKNKTSYKTAT